NDIAVGGGHRQPALVVNRDGGLALEHCAPGCLARLCGRFACRTPGSKNRMQPPKTTKNPVFPLRPTLGRPKWLVNNFPNAISLTGSISCSELQSLIQDLSTNRCFVSYFETKGL